MAVSPSSLNALSANELATLALNESIIDKELKLNYEPGKPVYVRRTLLEPILAENIRVLTALKANYEALGWSITEYAGKEGLYLLFKD